MDLRGRRRRWTCDEPAARSWQPREAGTRRTNPAHPEWNGRCLSGEGDQDFLSIRCRASIRLWRLPGGGYQLVISAGFLQPFKNSHGSRMVSSRNEVRDLRRYSVCLLKPAEDPSSLRSFGMTRLAGSLSRNLGQAIGELLPDPGDPDIGKQRPFPIAVDDLDLDVRVG